MSGVVITGIGYIGAGAANWHDAVAAARAAPPDFAAWPEGIAAPSPSARIGLAAEFPRQRWLTDREAAKIDRAAILSTTAVGLALEDAGMKLPLAGEEVAAFFATCRGEIGSGQRYAAPMFQGKPRMLNPALFPLMCRNLFCGQVAITFGLRGMNSMMSGGPLSGLQALARAADAIRRGRARMALTGAVETLTKFSADFAREVYGDRLLGEPRFFGEGGALVAAEGAAMLVLEREEDAVARGAAPYARLDGEAFGHLGRQEDAAAGLRAGAEKLLSRSGLSWRDIALASTSESGAAQPRDAAERGFYRALGEACPPLAAARSFTGEAESMSGVAEVALAAEALKSGVGLPVWRAAPSDLPVYREAAPLAGTRALVSAVDEHSHYAFLALSKV